MKLLAVVLLALGVGAEAGALAFRPSKIELHVHVEATPQVQPLKTASVVSADDGLQLEPNNNRAFYLFAAYKPGPKASVAFDQWATQLKAHPKIEVELQGSCDNVGEVSFNNWLGMQRAIAARDELVARGISPTRITLNSLGSQFEGEPNANRYVAIVPTSRVVTASR